MIKLSKLKPIATGITVLTLGVLIGLLVIPLFQQADAQEVTLFDLEIPEIESPPECPIETLTEDRAYLPFELRVFYDFNRDATLEFTQIGNSHPTATKGAQTYFFFTQEKDEYNITLTLQYATDKERAVKIEYVTAGDRSHSQIIPYSGGKFCKQFHIITGDKPVVPTLEEVYGEVVVTMIEEVPHFVPAFRESIQNTTTAFLFIALAIGLVVLLSLIQLFVYLSRRKQDKKLQREVTNSATLASKASSNAEQTMKDIKEKLPELQEGVDKRMDAIEINVNTKILEIKHSLENAVHHIATENERMESKKISIEVEIQKEKARLDKQHQELRDMYTVEDEGTMRNILNQFPIEKLKNIARVLKGKTDKISTLQKKIITDIYQRKKSHGEIVPQPEQEKEQKKEYTKSTQYTKTFLKESGLAKPTSSTKYADVLEMDEPTPIEALQPDEKTFASHDAKTEDGYYTEYKVYSYEDQVKIYEQLINRQPLTDDDNRRIKALNRHFKETLQ